MTTWKKVCIASKENIYFYFAFCGAHFRHQFRFSIEWVVDWSSRWESCFRIFLETFNRFFRFPLKSNKFWTVVDTSAYQTPRHHNRILWARWSHHYIIHGIVLFLIHLCCERLTFHGVCAYVGSNPRYSCEFRFIKKETKKLNEEMNEQSRHTRKRNAS